jgi:hypothetical protein
VQESPTRDLRLVRLAYLCCARGQTLGLSPPPCIASIRVDPLVVERIPPL